MSNITQGLKSQHVTSIAWLAQATDAETRGLEVGSKTLEFHPLRRPWDLFPTPPENAAKATAADSTIRITASSPAASALLIFQAVLPFLLFASSADGEARPIPVEIHGGTNVSFSLSYEYLDQVLLPALHTDFGIRVD